MKLYIAGPMKDWDDDNKPAFRKTRVLLENEGHEVISPLDIGFVHSDGKFDFPRSFHGDLTAICLEADGVVVMPGWETSDGASIEAMTARRIEKPVWELSVFLLYGEKGPTL